MKKIRLFLAVSIIISGAFSALNCGIVGSEMKKLREKSERNRIYTNNEKINRTLKEGAKAYDEGDYNLAIQKFEEGFNSDPTFPGSAPVFLNNKAQTLITRGTNIYNSAVKSDEATRKAAKQSAKKDFEEAILSSEKALEILRDASAEAADVQEIYEFNTLAAFTNRKNAYRLLSQTGADRTKGKTAVTAFREYLAVEPDPAKKARAQLDLALTLQDSDEFELAVAEFRKILETDPNNVDALAGIGLNLVSIGYANEDLDKGKAQLKEATQHLQHYLEIAPENHKFKQEAQGIIETLKESENSAKKASNPVYSGGRTNRYTVSEGKIVELKSDDNGKTAEK